MADHNQREPLDEMVPADDAVIGRAFWWSMAVAAAAGIGVLGFWWSRPAPVTPPRASDEAPPIPAQERPVSPAGVAFRDVAGKQTPTFIHTTGAQGDKLLPETLGGGVAVADIDADGDNDIILVDGCTFDGPAFSAPQKPAPPLQVWLNDSRGNFTVAVDAVVAAPMYGMGIACGDFDADGLTDLFVTGVGEDRLYRNETAGGTVRLRDVTTEQGIAGDGGWSTSAGFFDADGDGDLDLLTGRYVRWSPAIDRVVDYRLAGIGRAYGAPTGFGGAQLCYRRNDGGAFVDATESAGFIVTNSATGEPVAKTLGLLFDDPDRDGDLDVFVANDTTPKFLFINDGHGHFTESGATAGFAFDRSGTATGAMGIDSGFIRPGDELALAIGNFANEPSSLFISRPGEARFSDDAVVEGLSAPTRAFLTFGVGFVDANLDGFIDLVQVNGHLEDQINRIQPSQSYLQRGQLFMNAEGATPAFAEADPSSTGALATPAVGRGLAGGDLDGDGDIDLVRTQAGGAAAVLLNELPHTPTTHWLRVRLVGRAPNLEAIGAEVELSAGGRVQRRRVSPTRSYLSQWEIPVTFGLGASTAVENLTIRWSDGQTQVVPITEVDTQITVRQSADR